MGEIAAIVGCSVRTIHRKLGAAGLSIRGSFTAISDSDLDAAVMDINPEFSRHGYRLVEGHLQSRAIKVPRYRVMSSLVRFQGVSQCGGFIRFKGEDITYMAQMLFGI